ncbi:MFS transporter [Terracidiphilus sp.]|jgi:Sugar (and other) transporter|uniref:MFS transporter n=1 Tax=Terracidiphilus sp. TaxID=1964191 RepID=UPI003C18DFEA
MIAVVVAIATYAMTLAPVTWVVLSEIFPTEVRATFMAVCTAALWGASDNAEPPLLTENPSNKA